MQRINFSNFSTERITLQTADDIENGIFAHAYDQWNSCVRLISSILYSERVQMGKRSDASNPPLLEENSTNNIIAFVGGRGTGKTTAMLSFINTLNSKISIKYKDENNKEKERDCNFKRMSIIDPSKLSSEDRLITLVIANLYKEIEELFNDGARFNSSKIDQARSIIQRCQMIYDAMGTLCFSFKQNIEKNPDTLETLSNLARGMEMRRLLYELVDTYLQLTGSADNKKYDFLVIPIDDLDCNLSNSYLLSEDLRCFFMIPNIIVTLAIKMEQMHDLIKNSFRSISGNNHFGKELMNADDAAQMAAQYLEKLVPMSHRIMMPLLTLNNLAELEVEEEHSVEKGSKKISIPLVDACFWKMYKKTGILLVKDSLSSHAFIPNNLRSLHQYLELLNNMSDVPLHKINDETSGSKVLSQLENNLSVLADFIVEQSASRGLNEAFRNILEQLPMQSPHMLCSYFVRSTMEAVRCTIPEIQDALYKDPLIESFVSLQLHTESISLGDCLVLMNRLQMACASNHINYYIAAAKVMLSIAITRVMYLHNKDFMPKELQIILGGSLCNPGLYLTPGQSGIPNPEWIPMRQADVGMDDSYVRMSYYVYGFYRMRRHHVYGYIDPHLYDNRDYPIDRYVPITDGSNTNTYISVHWLSFISRVLTPQESCEALLGAANPDEDFSKNQIVADLADWQKRYLTALPVNSVDFCAAILDYMQANRYSKMHKNEGSNENFIKIKNYDYVIHQLKKAVDKTCEKTCLAEKEESYLNRLIEERIWSKGEVIKKEVILGEQFHSAGWIKDALNKCIDIVGLVQDYSADEKQGVFSPDSTTKKLSWLTN